ncbi:MAG: hypothetical protein JO332_07545 [Planctomycetaceae bacterium]|nr:hypothetical protein [Planctomycetaceae bacterium]
MTASPNWDPSGHSSAPMGTTPSSNVWSSRTQWGAIVAGAVAGFGAFIIMTTLGAALGITAGTVAGHNTDNPTGDTAGKAAMAFSIGTGVWMLITAAVIGVVGGYVLNTTSRRDRPYSPVVFGGITWAIGVCILLMVATPMFGGVLSGVGAGAGGAAAGLGNNPEVQRMMDQARSGMGRTDQNPVDQNQQNMTEEQKAAAADAAKKAATAATIAAWVTLLGQLVGLGATIVAAGYHRHVGLKVQTELRPRAAALT